MYGEVESKRDTVATTEKGKKECRSTIIAFSCRFLDKKRKSTYFRRAVKLYLERYFYQGENTNKYENTLPS